jgi:hypothetical protein
MPEKTGEGRRDMEALSVIDRPAIARSDAPTNFALRSILTRFGEPFSRPVLLGLPISKVIRRVGDRTNTQCGSWD